MTHRTEVLFLWMKESDVDWEKTIIESKFSHYPLCDEVPDNVVGILCTREYFRLKQRNRESVMEKAVRPVQFVPETIRADILFHGMKKSRNHFAVVLDEYGGMSGIVTMNDLLEQLVGDLEDDETAPIEQPPIEVIGTATWRIQGSALLVDVEKATGRQLPADRYDTFSGLVFGLLGAIPKDGEIPIVEGYGLKIEVEEIQDHRLQKAIVTIIGERD